jgi:hypothetical protein
MVLLLFAAAGAVVAIVVINQRNDDTPAVAPGSPRTVKWTVVALGGQTTIKWPWTISCNPASLPADCSASPVGDFHLTTTIEDPTGSSVALSSYGLRVITIVCRPAVKGRLRCARFEPHKPLERRTALYNAIATNS